MCTYSLLSLCKIRNIIRMASEFMRFAWIIVLAIVQAQKPCVMFLNDELGCIQTRGFSCSWNEFTSSCQSLTSTNLGCSPSLNFNACIRQIVYPNDDWAYCRFSGFCRPVTTDLNSCDDNLSAAACLGVTARKCKWDEASGCLNLSDAEADRVMGEPEYSSSHQYASVLVCAGTRNFPLVHSWDSQTILQTLQTQNQQLNADLARQYQDWLNYPGCIVPDTAVLTLLGCSAKGLNLRACMSVTTPGEACIYIGGMCRPLTSPADVKCSDPINKLACLSITNINEPCFWDNGCKKREVTLDLKCTALTISGKTFEVSPSFCAANVSRESENVDTECFYDRKKRRCHSMCRSKSAKGTSKACRQSIYGCTWTSTGNCIFKDYKSQCGILGQNKAACMNAQENCQFIGGFCKSLQSLEAANCTDGLNKKACLSVTKKGQLCTFDQGKCQKKKRKFQDQCTSLNNVNANVCQRYSGEEICYWFDGNCAEGTNPSCTQVGLNRHGCLNTKNTQSPCQWQAESGLCTTITVVINQTKCDLKLVNDLACRSVQARGADGKEIKCYYDENNKNCVEVQATTDLNCGLKGLNRAGCVSITDATMSCRFLQGECTYITTSLNNVACASLQSVTQRTCSLVTANNDPCVYSPDGSRCTQSVQRKFGNCNYPGVNPFGCAYLDNDKSCYFNTESRTCTEITALNNAILTTLECVSSYANRKACLQIKTDGQRCQWDVQKLQCISFSFPTLESCEWLEEAGVNLCIGYEKDVKEFIDESSRCTVATDTTKCALYTSTDPLTDCGTNLKINLHTCVALGKDTDPCYFDMKVFKCSKLAPPQAEEVLSTILCKQAGKNLCEKIMTPGEACFWNDTEKKCLYQDQCAAQASETNCLDVKQPCVWDVTGSSCYLMSTSSTSEKCTETTKKFNQRACLSIRSEACKWTDAGGCAIHTVLSTHGCDFETGDTRYNAITCGLITKSGSKCSYNVPTNKCVNLEISQGCGIGQNAANCLRERECSFADGICTKLPYDCGKAKTLQQCRELAFPCMWVNSLAQCKPSPSTATECDDLATTGTSYNEKTCNAIETEASKICASVLSGSDYVCKEILNKKCETAANNPELCKEVENTCEFVTTCKKTNRTGSKCSDYFTRYWCVIQVSHYCQWVENKCSDWEDDFQCNSATYTETQAIFSTQICYAVGCYLSSTTFTCTEDTVTALLCEAAKSPTGCKRVQKNCYWDVDNKCKELTDLTKAKSFSFAQVYYSNQNICLLPEGEGVLTFWDTAIMDCYEPDLMDIACNALVNVRACELINNDGQFCVYRNNQCQVAQLNTARCTDLLNIQACVGVSTEGQYCVWLGQKCANLTADGYKMDTYDTVNQHSCRRTYTRNGAKQSDLPEIGVKFDLNNQGCVPSTPLLDRCSTPGLNFYGCLLTKVDSCTWDGTKCISFFDYGTKQKCSDYSRVSAKVCEQIRSPGLKCYFSNYGCATATAKLSCDQSLNQEACAMQTIAACMWKDNRCQFQEIISGVTSCFGGKVVVNQISSPYSCQLVNYEKQICFFDQQKLGCTSLFDPLVHGCSTPGLNLEGCSQVRSQKCIFQNNLCQVYEGTETICRNLKQVNALVCAALSTLRQPCKFSPVKRSCVEAVANDLCNSSGMNDVGCKQISRCTWDEDEAQCLCKALTPYVRYCKLMSEQECKDNSTRCVFSAKVCRARTCSDLPQCLNQQINGTLCYLSINQKTKLQECLGAKQCEDIIGVENCSSIVLNGKKCAQHTSNTCASPTCETYTSAIECTGQCQWNGTICSTRRCSYITVRENCGGTLNNESCTWYQNQCLGLTACQQYTLLYTDQTKNQEECNKSTIFGQQCRWQLDAPFSSSYECSSNPCRPQGSSRINCEGAEAQNQVCVLTSDFTCVSCESITNSCECASYIGLCRLNGSRCQSITCDSMSEESCKIFTDRCLWHQAQKKCLIQCQKLQQRECEEMKVLNLCYWDLKLIRCNSGVPTEVVIDTVTPQLISTAGSATQTLKFYALLVILFQFF